MQTFLPYKDFERCAQCLDNRRLGKQRVEVLQILKALNSVDSGWRNHPAVLMWNGYTEALIDYGVVICTAWIRKGYKDTCLDKIVGLDWGGELVMPPWLTDEFCRSHQSNLVRKDPEHYRRYFPDVPDNLEYIWPVSRCHV